MPAEPAAHPTRSRLPRALPLLATGLSVLALGACGSSHTSGTSVDPATAVPASAPLYAGADVRPSGDEKADALAVGKALTNQANPYLRLLAALQTPGSPRLRYDQDVAPWLGPHAGVFVTSLGSGSALGELLQRGLLGSGSSAQSLFPFAAGGTQGALVLDTSDASKARGFLSGQAKRAGAHATSYRGVSLEVSPGGVAFALAHRLAVIGSQAAVRSVIDTLAGGPALASASGYAKLLSAAPAQALAHVYSNPQALAASGAAQQGAAGLFGLLTGAREANVSVIAKAGSLALDADTLAAPARPGGLISADPEGAAALGELPGDSWLALGLGHLGTTLSRDAAALGSLGALAGSSGSAGASALDLSSLLGALIKPLQVLGGTSAQARRDFSSWMGSGGVFASGGSLLELKAAVVIASKDPARSRAAVAKLAARLRSAGGSLRPVQIPGTDAALGVALPGLPVVLDIADGRDASGHAKFVLGLAEASVTAALHPSSTLAAAPARAAGAAALGEGIQPSLMADFPTLLSLLEGVGLSEDPGIATILPFLRAATTLSGGAHVAGGEVERFRLVLGLRAGG